MQTTGGLGYLDYGARMYDPKVGRWFGVDPLSEKYYSQSSYNYCGNSPVLFIDPNGEDYWSTNNPVLIAGFLNGLRSSQGHYSYSFDMSGWSYASDAEFLNGLTYSKNSNRFFFDYGDVVSNVATRIALSLPGHVMLLDGNIGIRTMHGMDETRWYNRASGRAEQDYTIDAMLIPVGKGLGALKSWLGKIVGKVAKSGTNLVYQGFDKAGIVRYVGITEREAVVRFGEHLSSGTTRSLLRYDVVPGAANLSRTGARVWEQTLINQYGLQKNGGLLLNKINSIAPKYWWQYGIK